MLPVKEYAGVNEDDPIRFYNLPVIGDAYRRRVELCLAELRGGERVLEIGFGSGVTFLNLHQMYTEIHGLDLTASITEVVAVFKKLQIETYLQRGDVLKMPYQDAYFDSILLISILEHLKPDEQPKAFREMWRVLKPGGQVVYGVPIERTLMTIMFRLLGFNIREHHFSTEKVIAEAACQQFKKERIVSMQAPLGLLGAVYQVGHFIKSEQL